MQRKSTINKKSEVWQGERALPRRKKYLQGAITAAVFLLMANRAFDIPAKY